MPTLIGCDSRVSTNACGFSELHILVLCFVQKKKKKLMSNNLQAKLKNEIV
jgi:hypothetical protein